MLVNQRIGLHRDTPLYVLENTEYPWRCDIWEQTPSKGGDWPLFATAWGKTKLGAQARANSIIQACAVDRVTAL